MKLLFIKILVVFISFVNPATELITYRKLMEQSAANNVIADQFYDKCKNISEDSAPILLGFKAMSELMLCNHGFNPMTKLLHFKKGKKMLEEAISRSANNPELRFFRFTVQSNVPAMLNYSSNLENDKLMLIAYLKKEPEDKDLHRRIKVYLLETKYCSTIEKELLKIL